MFNGKKSSVEKIRITLKRRYSSGKIVHPMLGKKHSLRSRKKMSMIRRKKFKSGEIVHPMSGKHLGEKTKRKLSMTFREGFASGKIVHPMLGKNHSLESRRKMSLAKKNIYFGEYNPNWRGGVSFVPYSPEFNDLLKEKVRNLYNRICLICFKSESDRRLDVHHVDYDKANNSFDNLVPLHAECHKKIRINHDRWIIYFKELIKCHQKSVFVTTNQISDLVELQPN